jgi:hypothetical protein
MWNVQEKWHNIGNRNHLKIIQKIPEHLTGKNDIQELQKTAILDIVQTFRCLYEIIWSELRVTANNWLTVGRLSNDKTSTAAVYCTVRLLHNVSPCTHVTHMLITWLNRAHRREIGHLSHDRRKTEFCCVPLGNYLFTPFSCQISLCAGGFSFVLCCHNGIARSHRAWVCHRSCTEY